ncbi:MAG TPA: helix-turn-helix domain-containing protein [Candidatus Brocadiaceae bacterium]
MVTPKEIKELREKIDATQAEFARALGVSFSTISRWENDEAQPSDTQEEQLDALKQILDNKKANIDKKKMKKMLTLMGIGGVIATAIIAGFTISSPLGASITSLLKAKGKLLDLFKKNGKDEIK